MLNEVLKLWAQRVRVNQAPLTSRLTHQLGDIVGGDGRRICMEEITGYNPLLAFYRLAFARQHNCNFFFNYLLALKGGPTFLGFFLFTDYKLR